MPPTTGTGMGIDRLLMALTGLSIRETVLFPIVRRHRTELSQLSRDPRVVGNVCVFVAHWGAGAGYSGVVTNAYAEGFGAG